MSIQALRLTGAPRIDLRTLRELHAMGTLTQTAGLSAFVLAWAVADPGYRYPTGTLAGLCGLVLAGLVGTLLAKTPGSAFLMKLATLGLLAEGFFRLAEASPMAPTWCLVLFTVFSLVMAPIFGSVLQCATALALVWLVMSRGRWLGLSAEHDTRWNALLVGAVAALGIFLNACFSRLRMSGYRQRLALEAMAYQDALTGLDNRRSLMERLQSLQGTDGLARTQFLMIDIDDFKPLNDGFGHAHGDAVLQALAATLRARSDPHGAVRMGGEEFAVLMEGCDRDAALALAQRLVEGARDLARHPAHAAPAVRAPLTISVGVATGRPGDRAEDLLRRSDQALYRAKHSGKDRFASDADATGPTADPAAGPDVAAA